MNSVLSVILILFNGPCYVLAQIPYPELIERIKPSIVGIEAHDDTLITLANGKPGQFHSYGSGVLVASDSVNVFALSNEHIVAIKDSNETTIRYAREIIVSINVKGVGAFPCSGKIVRVNEALDLVAVRFYFPSAVKEKLMAAIVGTDIWEDESNLREGEAVVYSGYPLGMGRGIFNSPLTRTGIISQLIPGSQTFLVDTFVQPGYSGSPVFLIRSQQNVLPTQWFFRFIGLCKAYPYSLSHVYQKVKLAEIPDVFVSDNPGFSVVIGVSAIRELFR